MLTSHQQAQNLAIIRRNRVEQLTGLSRSGIYDKLDKNSPRYDATFPTPIKLGCSAVGWIEGEVYAWINSRIALSRQEASHA